MKTLILIGMFLLQQPQSSPTGVINGRVSFRDGFPAARWTVIASGTAIPASGILTALGTSTDETGAYTIERVPVGTYYVSIIMDGELVSYPGGTGKNPAKTVVVEPGATLLNIDIVIPTSSGYESPAA